MSKVLRCTRLQLAPNSSRPKRHNNIIFAPHNGSNTMPLTVTAVFAKNVLVLKVLLYRATAEVASCW